MQANMLACDAMSRSNWDPGTVRCRVRQVGGCCDGGSQQRASDWHVGAAVLRRVLPDALAAEFLLEAMRVCMNALRLAEGECRSP